jgi:hypothetical protein
VVRDHLGLAEALLERVGHPLDQPAGVDEHQRRLVLADQLGDAIVDPAHLLERRHRAELVVGDLDRQVDVAAVAAVDDRRRGPAPAEQRRDALDRPLGRRQPDPHRRAAGGLRTSRSRRSSDSARCAPRLSPAIAWISSTITVRTWPSAARPRSVVSRM